MKTPSIAYLCFDSAGSWRRNPKVIQALIAYMKKYYPSGPNANDLQKLKRIIDTKPLDKQAVSGWFHVIYPPESTRNADT